MVAVHSIGLLVTATIALYPLGVALAQNGRNVKRAIHGVMPAVLVALATFVAWYFYFFDRVRRAGHWSIESLQLSAAAKDLASLIGTKELFLVFRPIVGEVSGAVLAAICIAAWLALLAWQTFRLQNRRAAMLLATAAAYWSGLLIVSIWVRPIFLLRTALPGLVPFFASVAVAVSSSRNPYIRMALAGPLIVTGAVATARWIGGDASRPVENFRALSYAIQDECEDEQVVLVYPDYVTGPLEYYLGDSWADRLVPVSFGELATKLDACTRSRKQLLVVRFDSNVARNRELEQYFEERTNLLTRKLFSDGLLALYSLSRAIDPHAHPTRGGTR